MILTPYNRDFTMTLKVFFEDISDKYRKTVLSIVNQCYVYVFIYTKEFMISVFSISQLKSLCRFPCYRSED